MKCGNTEDLNIVNCLPTYTPSEKYLIHPFQWVLIHKSAFCLRNCLCAWYGLLNDLLIHCSVEGKIIHLVKRLITFL